jgi:hypothetical protein
MSISRIEWAQPGLHLSDDSTANLSPPGHEHPARFGPIPNLRAAGAAAERCRNAEPPRRPGSSHHNAAGALGADAAYGGRS